MSEIPYSLASLAGVCKREGYETQVVINTFREPLTNDDFLHRVESFKPDFVGISMLTMQVLRTYDLIRSLKSRGYTVIVGGVHATTCPEEVLRNGADIVVRNEGEETLAEILQGKPINGIMGVTYREDGEIFRNPDRPRIVDTDRLPTPDFDAFDLPLFNHNGLMKGIHRIFTSRGCPGECTFCDATTLGRRVTFMPIQDLMADIQRRVDKYGIRQFVVDDDCFTVNKKHVKAFCEAIKKITPSVTWQAEGRVDMMTPEIASMLVDAGCYQMTFGIESGDPETLLRTRKRTTVEQNIKAAKIAHKAGLQVDSYLMFGFPWETPQSLQNTLNMVYELWDDVHLFNGSGSLTPFPGTELYKKYVDKYGFREYWLNPKYQDCGQSLYQNAENPYAVSTLTQRFLYDDTYIREGYFFPYTDAYKAKMREVAYEIGRHNLESMYPGQVLKQKSYLTACKASDALYSIFPNLEKGIGKLIATRKRPAIEERRFAERGNVNA